MSVVLGVLVAGSRRRQAGGLADFLADARAQEQRLGVRRLFLAPDSIDLQTGTATAAWAEDGCLIEGQISELPCIYHNLLVHPQSDGARLLRELNGRRDVVVFNETNRFDRGMLYEMLRSDPALADCLPDGEVAGPGLYLLAPGRRSLRNAFYLNLSGAPEVRYWHPATGERGRVAGGPEAAALLLGGPGASWLAPLPGLPAGPGMPVEWRFYLERSTGGDWAIDGEVAKYDYLRESGRRERCWPQPVALRQTFGDRAPAIGGLLRELALRTAVTLSRYQPGFVRCALDFWLTEEGRPVLADLSGRFRTGWLAGTGQWEALERVSEHPARFALMLAETGVGKLNVDFGRAGRR